MEVNFSLCEAHQMTLGLGTTGFKDLQVFCILNHFIKVLVPVIRVSVWLLNPWKHVVRQHNWKSDP